MITVQACAITKTSLQADRFQTRNVDSIRNFLLFFKKKHRRSSGPCTAWRSHPTFLLYLDLLSRSVLLSVGMTTVELLSTHNLRISHQHILVSGGFLSSKTPPKKNLKKKNSKRHGNMQTRKIHVHFLGNFQVQVTSHKMVHAYF